METKNYISFDLEYWYDSEFVLDKNQKKDCLKEGLSIVKQILKKHNVKATFFVTGKILEDYPEEVKLLSKEGHEIASHNYEHKMLNKQTKKEFEESIDKSKKLIKNITGKNPVGFRAPSWSISKKEFWTYSILKKEGFKYSSSLFPVNAGLYGSSKFPVGRFKPLKNDDFLEIPIRPFSFFSMRFPFAGGIYFRIIPVFLTRFFIKKLNKKRESVIVYFHPWEFCKNIPRTKTTLVGKITTYFGLKKNASKLDYLLSHFKFFPLWEVIKDD